MRELIKNINESAKKLSQNEQKEISTFSKHLESYRHVPTNEKDIDRMNAFSSNEFLVNFILGVMEQYDYPKDSNHPFDIISYWYCICLLMLSNQEKAKNITLALAHRLLKSKHQDLWQFKRILEFIDKTEYHPLKEEIENHLFFR